MRRMRELLQLSVPVIARITGRAEPTVRAIIYYQRRYQQIQGYK